MEKKLLTIFGASGLVGSSILREALDKGYHVNGTLRDIEKQDRITRLKSLPSGNNAKFFQADMAEVSSLDNPLINSDAAIICCLIPTYKGFDGTPAKELDDERGYNEIIKPTVDGCLNILKTAKRNNVIFSVNAKHDALVALGPTTGHNDNHYELSLIHI